MKLKKKRSVFKSITAVLVKEKMDLKKNSRHPFHIYTHYNKWRLRHTSGSPFKNAASRVFTRFSYNQLCDLEK